MTREDRQARLEADLLLAGPPTAAVVKHFDKARGFGFARLQDGTSLHFRGDALRYCGGDVEPGTTMVVRAIERPRGAQIVEILSIDPTTATPRIVSPLGPARIARGVLKWTKPAGYGFVALEGGGSAYVSRRVAAKAGLCDMPIGAPVDVTVADAPRGPVALRVEKIEAR